MNWLNHRWLLVATVIALALSGCTAPDEEPTPTTTTTGGTPQLKENPEQGAPTPPTVASACDALTPGAVETPAPREGATDVPQDDEAAKQLFLDAIEGVPAEYDMHLVARMQNGNEMIVAGAFRAQPESVYMLICGIPREGQQMPLPFEEIALRTTPNGSGWIVNGTVAVSGNATGESTPGGSPEQIAEIGRPGSLFGIEEDGGESLSVTNPRAVTYRGEPAVQMHVTGQNAGGEEIDTDVIVRSDPPRLVRIEGQETGGGQSGDPFANAVLSMEFYAPDAIGLAAPEHVQRAMGLGFTSDGASAFDFGQQEEAREGPHVENWTFWGDAAIPLHEVAVLVKNDSGESSPGGFPNFEPVSGEETRWSMYLSEGTKTVGNLTLTFDDADGSGTVSPGDVLRIEDASGEEPSLALFDTKTGAYVVPGPALLVALGALALVALALRRN